MLNSDAAVGGAVVGCTPPHRPISRLDSYFDSPDSDSLGVSRTLPRNIRPESLLRSSVAVGAGAAQRPHSDGKLEGEAEDGPIPRNGRQCRRSRTTQSAVSGKASRPALQRSGSLDPAGAVETTSASAATSRDVPPIPTDSTAGAVVAPPSETLDSISGSEITTRGSESGAMAPLTPTPDSHCTPADEDATGKDLSELADEEVTLDRLRSPVPVALELLDRRLNPADAYENIEDDRRPSVQPSVDQDYQNVGTVAADATANAATVTAARGESASAEDAADAVDAEAYEPIIFSGSSADAEMSEACETETFENEAYEHRVFDSQTYENETFEHVADLSYENVNGPEERDDRWVYEDVTPAPTPVQPTEDRDYEPVCVARAEDEVYEQVREFRRTLNEVNSIAKVADDKGAEPTAKASPGPKEAPKETYEEVEQPCDDSLAGLAEEQPKVPAASDASQEDIVAIEGFQESLESMEAPEGTPKKQSVPEENQSPRARTVTLLAERVPQTALFSRQDSPIEGDNSEGNISPVSVEPSTSLVVEAAVASAAETEPLTRPSNPEPLTAVDSVERSSAGSPEEPATTRTAEQSLAAAEEPSAEVAADDEHDHTSEPSVAEVEPEKATVEDEADDGEEGADVASGSLAEPDSSLDNVVVENDDVEEAEDPSDSETLSVPEQTDITTDCKQTNSISQERRSTKLPMEDFEEVKTALSAPPAGQSVSPRSVRQWRRPPVARSQTLPASVLAVNKKSEQVPSATNGSSQSGNTWPVRRPADFTTAAVARILPLPAPSDTRVSSRKSSSADRLDSSESPGPSVRPSCRPTAGGRRVPPPEGPASPASGGAAPAGVGRRPSELAASNSDLRPPSLRRASVRQLLSRFEGPSAGDVAVQDGLAESTPMLTERAVGSVHELTSRGSYALATRSLPRPATRRRADSPNRQRWLPATEGLPASPRPVSRHLSFQTVVAPEVRVAGVSGHSFRRTPGEEQVLNESAVGGDDVKKYARHEDERRLRGIERRPSQRSFGTCNTRSFSLEREKRKRPESLPILSRPAQETNISTEKSIESTGSTEASESSALSAGIPATTLDATSTTTATATTPDATSTTVTTRDATSTTTTAVTTDATARERIERYKEERRLLLRERFNAESFLRMSARDGARSSGSWPSPPGSPAVPAASRPLRRADSLSSPLSTAVTAADSTASADTAAAVTESATAAPALTATVTASAAASVTGSTAVARKRTSERSPTRRANSLRTPLSMPSVVTAAAAGPAGEATVRERVAGWSRRPRPAAVTRQQSAPEVSNVRHTPEMGHIRPVPEVGKIRHMAARFEGGSGDRHRNSAVPTL